MMPPLGKARREEKLAQRNARRKDSNARKSIGAVMLPAWRSLRAGCITGAK